MTLPVIAMMLVYGCASSNDLFRAPTVGIAYDNQVPILVKGISEGKVRIEYRKTADSFGSFTGWGQLSEKNSLTTNLFLKDLDAGTDYTYRIEFEDESYSKWFKFKTFPEQGKAGKFNFIFSSCVREKYLGYNVFGQIEQLSPSFVALLGDQMYADYDGDINKIELYRTNDSLRQAAIMKGEIILKDTTVLEAFRNKYTRIFDSNYQHMVSKIPVVATWDDHDYGQDNSDSTYRYKEEAKKVFKENFPDYPFEQKDGGLYYKFSIADVDVFVIDTRWYRSPMQNDDGEGKTVLGLVQELWLKNGLKNSKAKIKIILSSVSLNNYGGDTSTGRLGIDNWTGYMYELKKILSFIDENDIKGVLVFSGDQHYPSADILNWKKPFSPVSQTDTSIVYSIGDLGTSVFDFSASPLNYKRTTGDSLKAENQKNPQYSFEIFRPGWAVPGKLKKGDSTPISIFGLVEVNTENLPAKVSVHFYELNFTTSTMVEIFNTNVIY